MAASWAWYGPTDRSGRRGLRLRFAVAGLRCAVAWLFRAIASAGSRRPQRIEAGSANPGPAQRNHAPANRIDNHAPPPHRQSRSTSPSRASRTCQAVDSAGNRPRSPQPHSRSPIRQTGINRHRAPPRPATAPGEPAGKMRVAEPPATPLTLQQAPRGVAAGRCGLAEPTTPRDALSTMPAVENNTGVRPGDARCRRDVMPRSRHLPRVIPMEITPRGCCTLE